MASILGTPQLLDETTNNTYTAETGSNRLVVAVFTAESSAVRNITSVTLGAQAFTQALNSKGSSMYLEVWYILEADIPAGSNAWAVTWDGSMSGDEGCGMIYTLGDIDQTDPLGNQEDNGWATSLTSGESTVVSVNNSVVLGMCALINNTGAWTGPTGGFTEDAERFEPLGTAYRVANVHKEVTTGATETWGYTFPSAAKGGICSQVFLNADNVKITDIATDEDIYPGESITITGTGFAASGNTVKVSPTNSSADSNAETFTSFTSEGTTAITFTFAQGGLPFGTNVLYFFVNNGTDENSNGFQVSLSSASGYTYVDITSVDPTGFVNVPAFSALAIGDQIETDSTSDQGGTITPNPDGTYTIVYGGAPPASDSFQARMWDATTYTWTALQDITVNAGTGSSITATSRGLIKAIKKRRGL